MNTISQTLLIFTLLITQALGAEADHYTQRNNPLHDISDLVNNKANEMLIEALEKANKEVSCSDDLESEKKLYKHLRTYFGNHRKGKLSKYLLYTNQTEVPKRVIPLKESIYGDWSVLNGYLLGKRSAAELVRTWQDFPGPVANLRFEVNIFSLVIRFPILMLNAFLVRPAKSRSSTLIFNK